MLDFENCQSLEKLVLDDEICGMVLHMVKGIEPKEDFPALERFAELLKEKHLLISNHTRKYLKEEFYFPGSVIDRTNRTRWQEEGSLTLWERASKEVARLINEYVPSRLSNSIKLEMKKMMEKEARRFGMERLPEIDI
jgi:trimethylamine--corrinoid protein Co-methyltransferase